MLIDMVNQNLQEELQEFQSTKNKEYEKTNWVKRKIQQSFV
jgi:hypothetical protein